MPSIIIKETQLVKLVETAMDLDIYVQPINPMVPGENEDFQNGLEDVKSKIEEIISLVQTGKKIDSEQKREIFKLVDLFNKIYEKVKYVDKKDIIPMI